MASRLVSCVSAMCRVLLMYMRLYKASFDALSSYYILCEFMRRPYILSWMCVCGASESYVGTHLSPVIRVRLQLCSELHANWIHLTSSSRSFLLAVLIYIRPTYINGSIVCAIYRCFANMKFKVAFAKSYDDDAVNATFYTLIVCDLMWWCGAQVYSLIRTHFAFIMRIFH